MVKLKSDKNLKTEAAGDSEAIKPRMFSFGDPDPSMTRRTAIGYLEPSHNDYYDLPIPAQGLSESLNSSPHHASAIKLKRNTLVSHFIEHEHLKRGDFSRLALDYLVFGNSYLEEIRSVRGGRMGFKPSLAKLTRRHKSGEYGFIKKGGQDMHAFKRGRIWHLLEPDINQEVYGVPDYSAALHAAWLNESATLFRRKYYQNGAHAGYIMYLTDPSFNEEDVEALEKNIAGSKGPGNFRSLFINAPNGDKDGLKIIHLAEAQAKDQFFNIKNVTRDDVLAAHRVPPQLIGVVPSNSGGFGSIENARKAFSISEIKPLQSRFEELNEWAGDEIIKFKPFDFEIEAKK